MSGATPRPPGAAGCGTDADGSDAFTLRFALGAYLILWPFLWASGRLDNPTHNLGMGMALTATLVLLCWRAAVPTSYRALRPWAIGIYQVMSPLVLTIAGFEIQMQVLPTPGVMGAFADMMRVLTGCRAHMLLFLGAGLPLDLLPQMAVQTLAVASVIALRSDCQAPLLDSQLMEGRFANLHALLGVGTAGLLPHTIFQGSRQRQCAAALSFFLIFGGWVAPLFLVARRAAGVAAPKLQRRQVLTASERVAVWLMGHVFLDIPDSPVELRWVAWYCLTVMSWLAAQLSAAVFTCC